MLVGNKKIFSLTSKTQILLPIHMFPKKATMKTMLTTSQCCWSESTLEQWLTVISDLKSHKQYIEKGREKKERNLKY